MAATCYGQIDAVVLQVTPDDIGINGHVRPGTWTPLLLRLRNQTSQPRQVICQWVLSDHDGDRPHLERTVTLTPGIEQSVWLYAPLPAGTNRKTTWQLRVVDAPKDKAGRLLARRIIQPAQLIKPTTRVIGVVGNTMMGLQSYETDVL